MTKSIEKIILETRTSVLWAAKSAFAVTFSTPIICVDIRVEAKNDAHAAGLAAIAAARDDCELINDLCDKDKDAYNNALDVLTDHFAYRIVSLREANADIAAH